jgi:hypothetical protein
MSKVYKRAGIVHVCYKGSHFAPEGGTTTITLKNDVFVTASAEGPDYVVVARGTHVESWVRTVIGNDDPKGYTKGKGKPEKNAKVAKVKAAKGKRETAPSVPKAIVWKKNGLPSMDEVDEQIRAASPTTEALLIMQVCWHNWFHATSPGNRNLVPFAGLQWPDKDATERVHALGRKLASQFKDILP